MRSYITTHLTIALLAFVIAILIVGSAWYIDTALENVETRLESNISASHAKLSELAIMTDRNAADVLTEQIITDCARRSEFENLLNTLGSASQRELLSAQNLFESCGSFYAERKALMVAQLEREYQGLLSTMALVRELRDLTAEEDRLTQWGTLVELEQTRSNFLNEQTSIQSEIITLLIDDRAQSRITELVRQAQNINESLKVTDAQIDKIRLTLI